VRMHNLGMQEELDGEQLHFIWIGVSALDSHSYFFPHWNLNWVFGVISSFLPASSASE